MEGSRIEEERASPQGAINPSPASSQRYSEGAPIDAPIREGTPRAASDDYEPAPPRKSARAARPCRVPGCAADVSGLKSYNWRYRICEEHRAAPSVVIDGMRVRFCQMCAKFHELGAFQGRKMSCQRKLDGHNARRRVGNRGSAGDGPRRSERVAGRSSSGGSSSLNMGMDGPGGGDLLAGIPADPASLGALGAVLAQAARQMAAGQPPAAPQWPGGAAVQPPAPAAPPGQTPADVLVGLLRMTAGVAAPAGAAAAPPPPPMCLPMLEAQALLQTLESIMADQGGGAPAGAPPPAPAPAPPVPGEFVPGVDAPVAMWPLAGAGGVLEPILAAVLGSGAAPAEGAAAAERKAAPAAEPAPPAEPAAVAPAARASEGAAAPQGSRDDGPQGRAPLEAAPGASAAPPPPPPCLPPAHLVRLSIKLFGCEPHQLEPSVHRDLLALVSAEAEQLEAYVRPGCTAVTLDLRVPAGAGAAAAWAGQQSALGSLQPAGAGAASRASEVSEATTLLPEDALQAVSALLGARRGGAGAAPAPFVVQVGGRVAVGVGGGGGGGAPAMVTGSSRGLAPYLRPPEPRAVLAGRGAAVTLRGRGIAAPTDLPLCRQRGANVTLDVLGAGTDSGGAEWVALRPLSLAPGCAELEVERGALLSEAVPLLVLPDSAEGEAAAAEVCAALGGAPAAAADRFVREAGWALRQRWNAGPDGGGGLAATAAAAAAEVAAVAEARGCPALAALLR